MPNLNLYINWQFQIFIFSQRFQRINKIDNGDMSNFPERNEPEDSQDMLGPRSEPDDKTKLPLIQGRRYQGFIDGLPSDTHTNANFSATGTQQNSAPELLKPQISAGGKTKKLARKGKPNNTVDNLS